MVSVHQLVGEQIMPAILEETINIKRDPKKQRSHIKSALLQAGYMKKSLGKPFEEENR